MPLYTFLKLQRGKEDSEVESLRISNLSEIGKASMFWDNAIAEGTNRKLSKASGTCLRAESGRA